MARSQSALIVEQLSASTKSEIANSSVTVAAGFFRNVSDPRSPTMDRQEDLTGLQVYGPSKFVNVGLPIFIALSSLGNVFAQTFSHSRGKLPCNPLDVRQWGLRLSSSETGIWKGRRAPFLKALGH